MTVATEVNTCEWPGNDSRFDFEFIDKDAVVSISSQHTSEIRVYLDASLAALGVDYSLTGTGSEGDPTVVHMFVAPALGSTLKIQRVAAFNQPFAFTTHGSFAGAKHERAFDHLCYLDQQLAQRATDREDGVNPNAYVVRRFTHTFTTASDVEATFPMLAVPIGAAVNARGLRVVNVKMKRQYQLNYTNVFGSLTAGDSVFTETAWTFVISEVSGGVAYMALRPLGVEENDDHGLEFHASPSGAIGDIGPADLVNNGLNEAVFPTWEPAAIGYVKIKYLTGLRPLFEYTVTLEALT